MKLFYRYHNRSHVTRLFQWANWEAQFGSKELHDSLRSIMSGRDNVAIGMEAFKESLERYFH